jgi:regulator of sirC expression with transglutaminase-like and TPR domain
VKLAASRAVGGVLAVIVGLSVGAAFAQGQKHASSNPVEIVRSVMSTPSDKIDFARAKLTFDKLYDPSTDVDAALKHIDGMVRTIRTMSGPSAPPELRLIALRTYIYKAGPWNQNNPFTYDFADPLGRRSSNQLLATYLRTRRGNCVSMPMLFLALMQRLGLKGTLSTAPHHVFVKYRDEAAGRWVNLETTSGANPTSKTWRSELLPMTGAAIANGLYMKTLSKQETLALMADIVLAGDAERHRYDEMLAVAEVLQPYYPNNLAVLLAPATAAEGLVQGEFLSKYPTRNDVPPELLDRLGLLELTVSGALNHAYALGWRHTQGVEQNVLAAAAAGERDAAPGSAR